MSSSQRISRRAPLCLLRSLEVARQRQAAEAAFVAIPQIHEQCAARPPATGVGRSFRCSGDPGLLDDRNGRNFRKPAPRDQEARIGGSPARAGSDRKRCRSLQPGEQGEIMVRGPRVSAYEDPEANDRAFSDGWFRTGDQGYLDKDGYLFPHGPNNGGHQPRRGSRFTPAKSMKHCSAIQECWTRRRLRFRTAPWARTWRPRWCCANADRRRRSNCGTSPWNGSRRTRFKQRRVRGWTGQERLGQGAARRLGCDLGPIASCRVRCAARCDGTAHREHLCRSTQSRAHRGLRQFFRAGWRFTERHERCGARKFGVRASFTVDRLFRRPTDREARGRTRGSQDNRIGINPTADSSAKAHV